MTRLKRAGWGSFLVSEVWFTARLRNAVHWVELRCVDKAFSTQALSGRLTDKCVFMSGAGRREVTNVPPERPLPQNDKDVWKLLRHKHCFYTHTQIGSLSNIYALSHRSSNLGKRRCWSCEWVRTSALTLWACFWLAEHESFSQETDEFTDVNFPKKLVLAHLKMFNSGSFFIFILLTEFDVKLFL